MTVPTQDQLFEEADRQLREMHPDAPEPLDEWDPLMQDLVRDRNQLREQIAGTWATELFPQFGLGEIDWNDEGHTHRWRDLRDQMLHNTSGEYELTAQTAYDPADYEDETTTPAQDAEYEHAIDLNLDATLAQNIVTKVGLFNTAYGTAIDIFQEQMKLPPEETLNEMLVDEIKDWLKADLVDKVLGLEVVATFTGPGPAAALKVYKDWMALLKKQADNVVARSMGEFLIEGKQQIMSAIENLGTQMTPFTTAVGEVAVKAKHRPDDEDAQAAYWQLHDAVVALDDHLAAQFESAGAFLAKSLIDRFIRVGSVRAGGLLWNDFGPGLMVIDLELPETGAPVLIGATLEAEESGKLVRLLGESYPGGVDVATFAMARRFRLWSDGALQGTLTVNAEGAISGDQQGANFLQLEPRKDDLLQPGWSLTSNIEAG
jgi:hypothetical protein